MCSYKVWIWLTAIYSIPLILILILGDIVTLVGLNAPHLFQYELPKVEIKPTIYDHQNLDNYFNKDDQPKLGEQAALKRIAYENQFKRNFNQDNSLEDITNKELIDTNNDELLTNGLMKDELQETDLTNKSTIINDLDENKQTTQLNKDENKSTNDKLITENEEKKLNEENTTTEKEPNDEPNKEKPEEKLDKEKNEKLKNTDDKVEKNDGEKSEEDEKQPKGSESREKSSVLKQGWNEFLNGLYANENKLVLNILVLVKLGFRILSLITLPLLIIGNQKNRSSYIKPFKMILFVQFLYSLGITIYYAVVSTKV